MKTFKGLCAVSLLALAGVANAVTTPVVIDDFTVTQGVSVDGGTGDSFGIFASVNPGTQVSGPTTSILGGYRDIYVYSSGGTTDVLGNKTGTTVITGPSKGNAMSISNDDGVTGTVVVVWDGSTAVAADPRIDANVNTTGLGGADLLSGDNNGILLDVLSIDLNVMASLDIWDMDGTKGHASFNFPNVQNHFFDFSAFTNYADLDLANVGAVRLELSGPVAWDGSLNLVTSTQVVSPSPLLLLGIGLLSLVGLRRYLA